LIQVIPRTSQDGWSSKAYVILTIHSVLLLNHPTGGLLGSISWFFLAGALVLLWFVVLSGVTTHTPLNKIYFLKADTTGIQGAHRPVSQWTFWKICGEYNANCDQPKAALPFGYAWYDSSVGAPPKLIG
jgi:hypothetical protein